MDLPNFTLLKQGAEAKIYKGVYLGKPCIAKHRFEKSYRHPDLDVQLRKGQIRAESKAIEKCRSLGIHTPTLYLADLKRSIIFMEYYTHNITAKEFIYKSDDKLIGKLSEDIGKNLSLMHSNNIVHGDLTTSNILLVNETEDNFDKYEDLKVAFIDFGLANTNASAEDKGVDLYVLERALLSTHSVAEQIFPIILEAYKRGCKNCKEIIAKFEDVRARGRKRTMVG